jgi:hypothetical protein
VPARSSQTNPASAPPWKRLKTRRGRYQHTRVKPGFVPRFDLLLRRSCHRTGYGQHGGVQLSGRIQRLLHPVRRSPLFYQHSSHGIPLFRTAGGRRDYLFVSHYRRCRQRPRLLDGGAVPLRREFQRDICNNRAKTVKVGPLKGSFNNGVIIGVGTPAGTASLLSEILKEETDGASGEIPEANSCPK